MSELESARHRLRSLAAVATIGLDRAGEAPGNPDTFLTHVATAGLQARAGWRPTTHPGWLAPAPDADRPLAPTAARATLRRLLEIADPDLIDEWAQLAVMHGVRADGPVAPVVLDWWSRQPRRSPAVFEMLGQTGAWLSTLNPEWRKPVAMVAVPDGVDEIWATGRTPERIAALTSLRRADPARARALVESTWAHDGASERKAFLEVLVDQRSLADEPFLEAALDDRSKQVRRQAAAILAALPGSRLRDRMAQRTAAIVSVSQVSRGFLGRQQPRITISPPATFDPAWDRDGVDEQPAHGVGPRAWWTRQILGSTDLSFWTTLTALDPDAILLALEEDEYAGEVEHALIAAARHAGQLAWSAAIARRLLTRNPIDVATVWAVVRALPHEARERLCLELAARRELTIVERWTVCGSVEGAWSETFSRSALVLLAEDQLRQPSDVTALARAADLISRVIAPPAADAFEHAIRRLTADSPSESVSRSIDRVRLRADMHKEFTS